MTLYAQCAWCLRFRFNGSWVVLDAELARDLGEDGMITHGICPTCLETVPDLTTYSEKRESL